MQVRLNFINRTVNGNKASILIFQDSALAQPMLSTVAWKVIRHCGKDCNHPFFYSQEFEIALGDSFGNYSPRMPAPRGSQFAASACVVGRHLQLRGDAGNNRQIAMRNELARGAVSANIYTGGRLLASRTGIAPGQRAVFEFKPALSIGVVNGIDEGQLFDPGAIDGALTELPLSGLASADIVMTGGGAGDTATRYEFRLENLQRV